MPQEETFDDESYTAPATPYQMSSDKADLLDKITPEAIVELLRNRLMGKMQDEQTGEWKIIPQLKDNAISELGAWDLSNLILSVSNKNISISKLNDKEIRRRAYSTLESAIKMMISNWKRYKIRSVSQIRFVGDIIFSITFITLKQCDNEGIRKMIMGTRQESHQISEYGEQKRKGGLFRRR